MATPTNYSRIVLRHIFHKLRIQDFRSSKVRTGIKHMGPSMAAVGVGHRMGGVGGFVRCNNSSAPQGVGDQKTRVPLHTGMCVVVDGINLVLREACG